MYGPADCKNTFTGHGVVDTVYVPTSEKGKGPIGLRATVDTAAWEGPAPLAVTNSKPESFLTVPEGSPTSQTPEHDVRRAKVAAPPVAPETQGTDPNIWGLLSNPDSNRVPYRSMSLTKSYVAPAKCTSKEM